MKKHFNIRLEENLIQNLKEKARQNNTTPTALITRWAEQYCNDKDSDPYKDYSNDTVTTSQLQSAIADIQSRLTQLENGSNDKATTSYLDQRLAEALEPLWETLDYLPFSNDTIMTNDDIPNLPESDDTITTSNDNSESNIQNIQSVTTDDYSNNSEDTATTEQVEDNNDSNDNVTTASWEDSDNKATTSNDKQGSNIQTATTGDYSNDKTTTEQTPSIFPPESKEGDNKDVSPAQESETPQVANAEGDFQDSGGQRDRREASVTRRLNRGDQQLDTQGQQIEADTQTDDPSTNWMGLGEMVAHLQDLEVPITKKKQLSDAVRKAKEESPEGSPRFWYRGFKLERYKYNSKTYQFRIIGRTDKSKNDKSKKVQKQTPPDSSQENDGGLSGWKWEIDLVKWLTQKGIKIGETSLRNKANKVSGEGEKEFTLNKMKFRQRIKDGRKEYCCVSLGNR